MRIFVCMRKRSRRHLRYLYGSYYTRTDVVIVSNFRSVLNLHKNLTPLFEHKRTKYINICTIHREYIVSIFLQNFLIFSIEFERRKYID